MNPSAWDCRKQLALLWAGHCCRVFGENVVRVGFFFYAVRARELSFGMSALVTVVLSAFAALILVPYLFYRRSSDRLELFQSALWCCLGMTPCVVIGDPTFFSAMVFVGLTAGIHFRERSLRLPDLARVSDIGLPRSRAIFWLGTIVATAGGLSAGWAIHQQPGSERWAAYLALAVFLGYLAASYWLVRSSLPPRSAPAPVPFEPTEPDTAHWAPIGVVFKSRATLFGLLNCVALGWIGVTVFAMSVLPGEPSEWPGVWSVAGWIALGSALTMLQPHRTRNLAWVPIGWVGLFALGLNAAIVNDWICQGVWVCFGILAPVTVTSVLTSVPRMYQRSGIAVLVAVGSSTVGLSALLIPLDPPKALAWTVVAIAASMALVTLFAYLRQVIEVVAEFVMWPMYRIHGHGPGRDTIPAHGPVLILANHGAYVDPLWIAKYIPRTTTPMMTSKFFDLWFLRPLMKHVFGVIRVPDAGWRREAPELDEAIAALDRGECVVIFPEAYLRRKENIPLRRFGQGVWKILKARPNTPVFVCWIEGGWGSYFSYEGGRPPMTGKRFDRWRRIDIAYKAGQTLAPDVLDTHRATREFLMEECRDARTILGLPKPRTESVEEAADRTATEEV